MKRFGGLAGTLLSGGLAGTLFRALALSTAVGVLATAALTWFVADRALELREAEIVNERARSMLSQLLQAARLPLRAEMNRIVGALGGKQDARALRAHGRQGLVIALRGTSGREIVYPPGDTTVGAILAEPSVRGVQRMGDDVLLRLSRRDTAPMEAALGLGAGSLLVAERVAPAELARRLPRLPARGAGTEFVFYHRGQPVLRYRWDAKGEPAVEFGGPALPRAVLLARMNVQEEEDDSAVLRLLTADLETIRGSVRSEQREGVDTTVLYAVREAGGAGGGFGGFTFAAPSASFELGAARIATAAVIVALAGIAAILGAVALVALVAARRLSHPIIATQRALGTIAQGDYSARVAVDRGGEIGELQRLTNRVAEELTRRERMKELMGKYLSKQVADHVMAGASDLALGGVRREVSVLFADVRGFTSYSEKHSAEDVTRTLNEYFEVVVDVIAAHEGVLDKYIGDGIMVVFGAPLAQPDHALRAVLTALEMQAALNSLNLKRAQRGDDPIAIGIGVNTGNVVSGNLGSIKRMEFTVIGDTVNLAARLEGRAGQGQILIGQSTYDKVQERVLAEHLGALPVKGKQAPVEIWLVKGIRIAQPQGGGTQ
jgi:class 3 adenylate cyclase